MTATVSHVFLLADDTPDRGTVTFSPVAPAVDDTPAVHTVTAAAVTVTLDDAGSFTVDLTASDDPGWRLDQATMAAGGMPYRVAVWTGGLRQLFTAYILTGVWDLMDLLSLESVPDIITVPEQGEQGPPGPQGPPGVTGSATFTWQMSALADADVDPGVGKVTAEPTGGSGRRLAISETDWGGSNRAMGLLALAIGDVLTVVYDSDGAPPATSVAQYVVVQVPVAMGGWWRLETVRTQLVGAPTAPPAGGLLQVVATWGNTAGLAPGQAYWGGAPRPPSKRRG